MEERPQIELVTVFHRDTCHHETHQRNIRDKRLKWTKHLVTFKEEKDEHILVEEGPQIECDTVFHRDTCHCEIYQSNIRDKRLPREACFHLGDVKVEMKRRMKTCSWERIQIERGTVFHRDICHREIHQRNIRDKRLPCEACFDFGDVKVDEIQCDLQ